MSPVLYPHPPDAAAWIVEAGLADMPVEGLVEGAVRHLIESGVALYRMHISFRILHPLFDGMSITWTEEAGVELGFSTMADTEGSTFRVSPFYHMLTHDMMELRTRLDRDAEAATRFPMLADLRRAGVTDYLALLVAFGGASLHPETHDGIGSSWATRAEEGFGAEDAAAIRRLLRPLALALRVSIKDQITRTALDTFHGPLVGGRILSGAIKRGCGERLHAALWYSDLRNSTGLADSLPTGPFLDLLNAYCECAAGAVMSQGGEVLDIIGDAILAIFPAEGGSDGKRACARALAAAADAQARLARLKAESSSSLTGLTHCCPVKALHMAKLICEACLG